MRNWALIAVGIGALGGCAVGPNYHRPETTLDPHFANAGEPGFTESEAVEHYWTGFDDLMLTGLIDDALAHNKDLGAAEANLRAARAAKRLAGFDQYPTATLAASYTHSLDSQEQLPGVDMHDREFDAAQAGFDGLWELDLFGRVRRNVEAARGDLGAAAATLQDARVSVIAEVARDYFILRGLQDQLALTQRNADNQFSSLKITRNRLEAGRGNELDTSRAEAQWQTTLASIPSLQASIAATCYRLSVLTGRQPTALNASLAALAPMPALPPLNAIGTPEQLLRRRPDVRVAERRLAAATARVGVAVGDLFPKVTLVGEVGYFAPTFGDFGKSEARFFSVGPSISWAAFDLGRVQARISSAKAQTDQALALYEGAVLGALEDTEGTLISYGRSQSRREALQVAAAASDKAADLARKRFEGGLIDFLEVLDAERTALSAELLLSQSRTDAATSLVAVYKALGAGWRTAGTKMKIYSWNVNGIRAVHKKGLFLSFIEAHKPDILCLQETKAERGQIEIELPNYREYWNSAVKKGYSGTAIFSKHEPLKIINGFPNEFAKRFSFADELKRDSAEEGRVITAEFAHFFVVTVYTPNAKDDLSRLTLRHKHWDPAFLAYCRQLEKTKPVVFCGDLNVAHTELDLANPKPNRGKKGFTDEERAGFQAFIDAGFVDTFRLFTQGNGHYSWWSHFANSRARNVGWRIDYLMVSAQLRSAVKSAQIHASVMGSDHCPVSISLESSF